MSLFEKLLPPPMRRPQKPGHANGTAVSTNGHGANGDGNGNGDATTALKDGAVVGAPGDGAELGPGTRVIERAKDLPVDLIGWVDERMGGASFLTAMLLRKVPKGTNWFYTLGSATMFAFVVQALTGVFLAMYYTPSPVEAYGSITHLTNDVFLGEFVRGMHKWGASVMVILVFVHMARTFFFGAYKYPRELNWVIGVVLLILTMTMGFTGYLLPFDQRSYWATIVGVNINGTGPIVGPYLSDFLRAGPEFGATTLSRFYAIHMLLVPGAIIAMIGAHLYLVVKLGTTAPPWLRADRKPKDARAEQVDAITTTNGDADSSNGHG
jgi:quinol---cytochrome c reductase cytochrome b subunit, bacillus type